MTGHMYDHAVTRYGTKFPYIVEWGKVMGCRHPYTASQLRLAENEGAPANALYKGARGWRTTDDISVPGIRSKLGLPPL